jgi:aminoglycoside 3-N-acetyltransferase
MISYHNLVNAFRTIGLSRDIPVITHLGKDLPGKVNGGLPTFMGALLSSVDNILLPAFTFSTMVTPQTGPADNNMQYGSQDAQNMHAVIFSHALPSECGNQDALDILKQFPGTYRSSHPIFSFCGLGLDVALMRHTSGNPYHPIEEMEKLGGWVLLADSAADQNFSIHYAEMIAGRKQFLRWALSPNGVEACPHFPGCPDGFHKLDFYLHDELRQIHLEGLTLSAVPLATLISTSVALLQEDPFALLCNDLQCTRCNLVREDVKAHISGRWKQESGSV